MKVITQIYFYHIPKFLKNSSGAKTRNQYPHTPSDAQAALISELSAIIELMVEPRRIELLTSCVQSRRSPS